jgi:hypothetical protein
MFKQYREIKKGEFILIGSDCSQGGEDLNCSQFLSKTKIDVPLVYAKQGVAAQMTSDIVPVAEKIFNITGIRPVIAFERQNGGASEMERVKVLNRNNKYEVFVMPKIGQDLDNNEEKDTKTLGWNTSEITRPILVGDLKNIVDVHGLGIYDEETIQELFWFILSRTGKPEAMRGKHDDRVISLGIAWQLYLQCNPPPSENDILKAMNELPTESWKKGGDY